MTAENIQSVRQWIEKRRQYSLKMSTYCALNFSMVVLGVDPSFHARYVSAKSVIWSAHLCSDVLTHWVQLCVSLGHTCTCIDQSDNHKPESLPTYPPDLSKSMFISSPSPVISTSSSSIGFPLSTSVHPTLNHNF